MANFWFQISSSKHQVSSLTWSHHSNLKQQNLDKPKTNYFSLTHQKSNLFSWFWLAQRKIGRSLMEGFPFISLNLDAGTIVPTGWLCVCWDTTSKEAPMDLPTWPQTRVLAVTPGKSRGHSVSAGHCVPRSPGSAGPQPSSTDPPSLALCFPYRIWMGWGAGTAWKRCFLVYQKTVRSPWIYKGNSKAENGD